MKNVYPVFVNGIHDERTFHKILEHLKKDVNYENENLNISLELIRVA